MRKIHVLSLGAGVQSSTLAFMADRGEVIIDGEVLKPRCAVFADTKSETAHVYKWLEYLKKEIKSFPIYTVSRGNLRDDVLSININKKTGNEYIRGIVPLFVKNLNENYKSGMLGRSCTRDYKIDPITSFVTDKFKVIRYRKYEKKLIDPSKGMVKGNYTFEISYPDFQIYQWLGISTDEVYRVKPSRDPWSTNFYPLIEMGMSRDDCLQWMKDKGYPKPARSSCFFCPYHSNKEWLRMKTEEPEEFQKAVEWEKQCQKKAKESGGLRNTPFLHKSCIPLDEIDFQALVDKKDNVNNFINECEGGCGV